MTQFVSPAQARIALTRLEVAHGWFGDGLRGDSRQAEIVAARRAVARALRNAVWPVESIAVLLRRHHTSVLHLLEDAPEAGGRKDGLNDQRVAEFQAEYLSYVAEGQAAAGDDRRTAANRSTAGPAAPDVPGYFTTDQAARRLRITKGRLRYLIAHDRIPALKVDDRLWIPADWIEAERRRRGLVA